MSKTAYINARLLDPATGLDTSGTLVTDGESIADFGEKVKAPKGAKTIDCQGKCLMPGLVDMRVQLREPGEEYKGTLESAGRAATEGGVTTMVCLPNTTPVIDDISVLEFVARRARKLGLAKVYPYGAVTKGLAGEELAEMGMLAEAGALAFTDGIHAISDARMMSRALSYAANFGLIIVQHAEEPSLAAGGCMTGGETATRLGLSGIPAAAEVIMVERDIRLVRMTGGRLHFAHVSTSDAIDTIRAAKAEGLAITCDTAPPYFALNETAIGDYRTFAKVSPPLRGEDDRQAVIEGIRDGTIDVIASDHRPQDQDSKRLPFVQAEPGIVGLETLLPLTLALHRHEGISLLDLVQRMTSAPGNLLRMKEGRLAAGLPADLLIFDPDHEWTVDAANLKSRSKNTPFDTFAMQGIAVCTIVGGRHVHSLID
ncbi:MAG: dihydroorotase [Rhodospirillaceae bacterium]|nr:dihydroorotase [Rhodospirillaceae bacterium]